MSIQSADDFDPSSSTPVFGSTVSQTKTQQQQQPTNDLGESEKLTTPPQPVFNGQNDKTNNKNSDNLDNGPTDSTDVHVNGENKNTIVETPSSTKDNVNSVEEPVSTSEPIGKSSPNEPLPESSNESIAIVTSTTPPQAEPSAPTEPEPALSTTTDTAKEILKSKVPTTVPAPPVETTTSTSNEGVPASATAPEATVLAESATPERKTKSPRGKAKTPTVPTPPTRQSTRAKKPVISSSTNEEEDQATEDTGASTSQIQSSPTPKRAKRQPASATQDATQASNQPTLTEEVTDVTAHDTIPSDVGENEGEDKTASTPKRGRASTSAGRKRGASSSPSVSASKKSKATPKGKKSVSLSDEQQIDVDNVEGNEAKETTTAVPAATSESEPEPVQTPPKKARTSGNRKTPTSTTPPESSGEYLRKLRPRK